MTDQFGHLWISNYGEKDSGTWAKALANFHGKQIAWGIRCTINSGKSSPPSCPEFVAYCRSWRPPPVLQLPRKRQEYDEVKPKIDELRKAIGGNHGNTEG